MRIDKWLWAARFFKTRALASRACDLGRIEFNGSGVKPAREIRIGETTQSEIRSMFGEPWRTGLDDGQRTWTYGRYRYGLFSEPSTTDLVIRFDSGGVVVSYSFSTTEHKE